MTTIEFLIGVTCIALVVLDGLILLELREMRRNAAARESLRRRWIRDEHTTDMKGTERGR